ncbi:unnamed protein product [Ciceribacter sp. T2.26MG-112.2]|uniref:hypothetical protein n=1 Tax=Ciceribacter sp. T2.26MG-112.2 TaxID=3137154 RepID=UPI000E16E81C|nr:hypothetical protein [Ciceribacter naphthalenivorans]SSC71429.1 unnamed protein product [Ciceribacter naphthalenivorans]
MKSVRVLTHIKDLRRGFDVTKMATPLSAAMLRPDRPLSGRLVTVTDGVLDHATALTFEEAGDRTDVAWVRPFRSTGTRQPAPRTRGSLRGHDYDVRLNRALGFESGIELKFATLLRADRSVVNIEDQPAAVKFWRPGAEVKTKHTIDLRATFASGTKLGFVIKHSSQLERTNILEDVDLMRVQCCDFADDFVVVTEREVTPELVENAEAVAFANAARNDRDCRAVLAFMQGTEGPVSMFDVAESFDEPGCAWSALLCLIFDGVVEHLDPGQLFEDAPFVRITVN